MLDATPLLGLYARHRLRLLQQLDPVKTQRRQLLRLLRFAADTPFGQAHDFATISSVAEYQKHVPLRRYEDFWNEFWHHDLKIASRATWPERIEYFAASSGTTSGKTKYIPVSRQMMAANRHAALDVLTHHWQHRPDTHVMGGKSFMLGGNVNLTQREPGIYTGDLSGIAGSAVPWWAKGRYFPPRELASIADWDEKVERLAPVSLAEDIRMLSGTSSWLLAFIERVLELEPNAGTLKDVYPNLELLVHGGVNFTPYKRRFDELLAGSHAETREVYPASEGFIGVADRGPGEGLRLLIDNGIFYEFVPVEELDSASPTRHWIGTVEPDRNYAIVMTTCAGLWSYILGDTVRFVDLAPPRLLVTGRTSYFLSAFGEHLIGEEIEHAIEAAAEKIGAHVTDYSVGALFAEKAGEKGRHLYIVEFDTPVAAEPLQTFIEAVDHCLSEQNIDYSEHRLNDFQMAKPLVQQVAAGTFAAWMKRRGKLGAQNKVPRVINDADLWQSLREFAEGN